MDADSATAHIKRRVRSVPAVLLAMIPDSGDWSTLPAVERTLPQAELLHRQLVAAVTKRAQQNCPELTGCDDEKRPLRLPHQHAHIFPLDLNGDGRLDHFLIHAAMGLSVTAQRAIRSVRSTYTDSRSACIRLSIVGEGSAGQLLHSQPSLSIVSSGSVWASVTPLVLPRYQKKSGKNSLQGQVQHELACRGLPPAAIVEVLKDESLELRHFIRSRKYGSNPQKPPVDSGFALSLRFTEPLPVAKLPLALGYGCHFGLGLFRLAALE